MLAGLFSNFLYPVYRIESFQLDWVSILICLTIAFLGTKTFAFFLSMKAVSLVSPIGGIGRPRSSRPLSSAILSVLTVGLEIAACCAMMLIVFPWSSYPSKNQRQTEESSFNIRLQFWSLLSEIIEWITQWLLGYLRKRLKKTNVKVGAEGNAERLFLLLLPNLEMFFWELERNISSSSSKIYENRTMLLA